MRKSFSILMLLLFSLPAICAVPISGNLKDLGTGAVASGAFVRFELTKCGANIPRITGTSVIVNKVKDFKPNASGAISGNLYGNDEIDCGGVVDNSCYLMSVYYGNTRQQTVPVKVYSPGFNINSFSPSSECGTSVPVTPPATPLGYIYQNPTADQTITQPVGTSLGVSALNVGTLTGSFTVDATKLTGSIDNARIAWGAPGAIGATTPAPGTFSTLLGKTIGGRIMAMAPFYTSLNTAILDAIAAGGGIVDATGGSLTDLGSFNPGTVNVTILLGPRTYSIGQITLADSLHIYAAGDSDGATKLQSSDASKAPFIMPSGVVQNVILSGFRLYGAVGNTNQNGINIVAGADGGGLWYSKFEHLQLWDFKGISINFDGTAGGTPKGINQFITLSSVKVFRPASASYALQVLGANGQFTIDQQCQFDGNGQGDGTNINIASSSSTLYPYSIGLVDTTCQAADICANIAGAQTVIFNKSHLENLNGGWLLSVGTGGVNTYNVNIHDGEIQTTGVNSGNGYILKTAGGATNINASFTNNRFGGPTPDAYIVGFTTNIYQVGNKNEDGTLYAGTLPPVTFAGSIAPDGGGLKHKRQSAGSVSASSAASVLLTWDTAFADTNYTATCSVEGSNPSTLYLRGYLKANTGLQVTVYNAGGSPETGIVDCVAIHD